MRALTFALTQPSTARAALAALADEVPLRDTAAVEALVELLARPHVAPASPWAAALLAECQHPLVVDTLVQSLHSPLVTVRLPAVAALSQRGVFHADGQFIRMLRQDDTWMLRRAVLRALAEHPEPTRWQILIAADDPHWRVRHALIGVLLAWGQSPQQRNDVDRRLAQLPPHPRIEGVRKYLQVRCGGVVEADDFSETWPNWPFHDPDPAVLVRNLEELGASGRRRYLELMPSLLSHEADRARSLAIETIRRWGETVHLARAVAQLDDPRAGAGEAVEQLLRGVDLDRIEETARFILHRDNPSPAQLAWAIDQAGLVYPPEEEANVLRSYLAEADRHSPRVRRALASLAGRWSDAADHRMMFLADVDEDVLVAALSGRPSQLSGLAQERLLAFPEPEVRIAAVRDVAARGEVQLLKRSANDPDSRVRLAVAEELSRLLEGGERFDAASLRSTLQADVHPLVRAAALTPERAAELIAQPEGETSWHVLAAAAMMQKVPLWRLEPRPPWQPAEHSTPVLEPLTVRLAPPPRPRTLGSTKLLVAPVGISGHYGLPVEGFVKAVEAGVHLLFWEPNYQTLTSFSGRLSASRRRQLHFLVGTFEANGARIRKDVERALRNLQIEQIALFLIFWTRTWERITDEVRGTLERLEHEGMVGMAGLSTHSRPLAVEAMAAGWNPVMVRHSAAHRGAETQVFPRARDTGTSLITFNNTCYGRLLKPQGNRPAPGAADCYRYTLSFPAVTMCMSAPATLEQLDENLQALHDPQLPEERRRLLLEQGDDVYREETMFRRLVRSR